MRKSMITKKWFASMTALVLAGAMMTGCGGGDDYGSYASAYNKVTANGGMDANLEVSLDMDGTTTKSSGNFKLDTSDGNNILYYEMKVGDSAITQFSDGNYIYTDTNGQKTKYAMNAKPAAASNGEKVSQKDTDTASGFNKEAFMSEFSGFLEAGKIKELGLLSPIEKEAISAISGKDGVYTLTFSDSLVKKYLNLMIANETQATDGDALTIDELNDFTYKATVQNDVVTGVDYSGTIVVKVPASLMESGTETSYDMKFTIKVTFVNPGEAVSVTVPSTDGYEEL